MGISGSISQNLRLQRSGNRKNKLLCLAGTIYANQREDDIDDVQYEKFNTLLNADNYSTEEKLDVLMGNVPSPFDSIAIFIVPPKIKGSNVLWASKR